MNKLSQLKHWLLNKRAFSTAWFAKGPQAKPKEDEALTQLPGEVADELLTAVNSLPTPSCEQAVVLDAVVEAISHWKNSSGGAHGSIVVLAHPVSSVARVLTDCLTEDSSGSLKERLKEMPLTVKVLDWIERPPDVSEIKTKIKDKLGWQEDDFGDAGDSGYETRAEKDDEARDNSARDDALTMAVIPNLCWCFLRSADGLDGIDYLQEMLLDDRHQFWVIGSGKVGWEYLNSTLKLGAYCGKTVAMPALSAEQLESWLEPVINEFDIRFSNRALHERLHQSESLQNMHFSVETLEEIRTEITQEVSATVQSSIRTIKEEMSGDDETEESDASPKRDYFNRLKDLSEGVSVVALQLFLKSLRYRKAEPMELDHTALEQKADVDKMSPQMRAELKEKIEAPEANADEQAAEGAEEQTEEEAAEGAEPQLIATFPKLPLLPDLDQDDLYMLYSLMLHGDLTIRALAGSLGDSPQVVNNQVQVLLSAEVIEQKNGIVKINPMHYPSLRRELSRNNFIIEVP